jgi:hypothetical protein
MISVEMTTACCRCGRPILYAPAPNLRACRIGHGLIDQGLYGLVTAWQRNLNQLEDSGLLPEGTNKLQ